MEIEMVSYIAQETVEMDQVIFDMAKKFETNGIRPRDALHLACALDGQGRLLSNM